MRKNKHLLLWSSLASLAPPEVSFGALAVWAVVPVLAAIARFRSLDLNE